MLSFAIKILKTLEKPHGRIIHEKNEIGNKRMHERNVQEVPIGRRDRNPRDFVSFCVFLPEGISAAAPSHSLYPCGVSTGMW